MMKRQVGRTLVAAAVAEFGTYVAWIVALVIAGLIINDPMLPINATCEDARA